MYLVHEDKTKDGRWQIAWTWMPFFLASDQSLHKSVSKAMTEEFRGTMLEGDVHNMYPPSMTPILERMHKKVVDLIIEQYPIPGLREYLNAIEGVQPEEKINVVAT